MKTNIQQTVSILGLGQMGGKLAELYITAGFDVTVWNRTAARSAEIKGASVVDTAEEALAKSTLGIICVYDNKAVAEVLENIGDTQVFAGKTILNLTTGSPSEAENLEVFLKRYGAFYLNGAIQVAPDQMGLPDTTILMAGDLETFNGLRGNLTILGGNLKHLGASAAASSAMDLATLTWLYGSYIGLLYGVKLAQYFGLKLSDYSDIVGEIVPGFVDFFKHEIKVIEGGDFNISQSPLAISVSATSRIAETFSKLPVLQEFPQIMASLLDQAEKRGLAQQELAALVNVIGK